MQITAGNVSITNGTSRVIGNAATDWTQVVAGYSWFSLIGVNAIIHIITAKTAPGSSTSGFWELTLQDVFTEGTQVSASYVIHKDFTLNKQLPLFGPGDVQVSQIWNRAMQLLDNNNPNLILQGLSQNTVALPKPTLIPVLVTVNGNNALRWYVLQVGAPAAGDVATVDDSNARWRPVG